MAEAAAAFLGAGATVGAAALVGGSGFTGRHENSLREEIQATKKSTADFMENLQRGDVTGEEEIVFWNTRAEAMETERSYSEALDIYKDASWIRNPVNKYRKQTEVRGKKRLTRKYNQSLESLNESMYSGSETSSIAASSGSPPGSNASAESIRDWADDIAENGEVYRSEVFRPHARQFGFFLDWDRLIQPAAPICSALLNVIIMWGAHLCSDIQRELHYKQKALQSVAAELTSQSFLHIIQAEVLLSYYFFRTGRLLEARAHTATAVALALGSGLHLIRSLNHPDAPVIEITEDNDREIQLRASADSVEEGERINGFWAVYMLQKILVVALEPPARVCGVIEASGTPIDTPWPLEMEDYKQGLLTSDIHGDSTVRNFLRHTGPERSSITAITVKASILLHRAVYMHGQYRPGCPAQKTQSWWTAFGFVDQLINTLRAELSDLTQIQNRSAAPSILFTHSLLDAATIQLHSMFYSDPTSRQNCLAAARDMFRFGGTNSQELGYLNPMMGTLWMTACNVFIDELRRMRAEWAHRMWPLLASDQEHEKEMLASLNDGLDALSFFARESLLMRHQLKQVQESMEAS